MNPVAFLREIYHYLNMEPTPGKPPSETIWAHDDELLTGAEAFYAELSTKLGTSAWPDLVERLDGASAKASLVVMRSSTPVARAIAASRSRRRCCC